MTILKKKGKIGIACLTSAIEPIKLRRAIEALNSYGYEVVFGLDPAQNYGNYDS